MRNPGTVRTLRGLASVGLTSVPCCAFGINRFTNRGGIVVSGAKCAKTNKFRLCFCPSTTVGV